MALTLINSHVWCITLVFCHIKGQCGTPSVDNAQFQACFTMVHWLELQNVLCGLTWLFLPSENNAMACIAWQ